MNQKESRDMRTRRDKVFDAVTIEKLCAALLEQGRIPSFAAVQNAGGRGDTKSICAVIREFKTSHAEQIQRIRLANIELLSDRGSLTKAVKHWRGRAEELEKENAALRKRLDILEAQARSVEQTRD
ncbi:MAG: DNA-binding protein [Bacteroidales bacterium]|nr:DNA-binding protein [Bacteroidales bacterium]